MSEKIKKLIAIILTISMVLPVNAVMVPAQEISEKTSNVTEIQSEEPAETSQKKDDMDESTEKQENEKEAETDAGDSVTEEKKTEDEKKENENTEDEKIKDEKKEETDDAEQKTEASENEKVIETEEKSQTMGAEPSGEAEASEEIKRTEEIPQMQTKTITYVNPIYEDVISEENLEPLPENSNSEIATYSNEYGYLNTPEEAVSYLREQMKNRETYIVVNYTSTENNFGIAARELSDAALEHTGVSTEGDYLKWSYGGWRAEESMGQIGGLYYFTVKYSVTYYTDFNQEQQVSARVSQVLSSLGLTGQNDYTKIKKIYDYICSNVTYDYSHLSDPTYQLQYTAYAALINGTSVCQGYAVLFYRMALQSGVDARLISGTGNGGPHAWNIVKIGSYYYNLDSTWDAGNSYYYYFLKNDSSFGNHGRDLDYATPEFYQRYPMAAENYSGRIVETPDKVSGLKIGGWASDALRLNWNKNASASGYVIEQKKAGDWTRIARIGSNSTVTYRVENLSPSTKYEFRVKAFGFDDGTPIYSDYVNVTGKTKPSMVTGVKIGGTAKDALRINWNKNTSASGYIIEQKKAGNWTRIARIAENGTTTYRVEKLNANTKYEFRIQAFGFDENTPLYSEWAAVSGKTETGNTVSSNVPEVTGVKIGGRAADALRLNWNKNAGASGYIIEQKKSGSWVRIARIEGNGNVTYRVEKLNASTTYDFRIQGFNFKGNTPVYSKWSYLSGKTNPNNVSGFRIGETAKDALRVNWNKNTSASGYIIEQYKGGKWYRIARLEGNAVTTYRVEHLQAATSYIFRISAFGFDGNTPLYSNTTITAGTTQS